jgi:hypothetical protein
MVLSMHDDDHKFFNSVRLKAMVLSRVFKQPAFIVLMLTSLAIDLLLTPAASGEGTVGPSPPGTVRPSPPGTVRPPMLMLTSLAIDLLLTPAASGEGWLHHDYGHI